MAYYNDFCTQPHVPETINERKYVPRPEDNPWLNDPFMGTKPVVEDIDQVDFRDYEFKKFARDNHKKAQPITRHKGNFYGMHVDTVVGSSPDNEDDFK